MKHKTVPLQRFSKLRDKIFLLENRDTSSLSRNQRLLESQNSSPAKYFETVKQKLSTENRDTSCTFRYQNFFEVQNSAPTKFFAIARKSLSGGKS